jgi:hypothetical protein
MNMATQSTPSRSRLMTGRRAVRDQLKENCTLASREQTTPFNVPQTQSKGGYTELLASEEEMQNCVAFVRDIQ